MAEQTSQPPAWLRAEARHAFGLDPEGYEAGRPEYPERVYEVLVERCGLRAGTSVAEIGPGTGRVTRRLARAGARVMAIEPDPTLARYLARTLDGQPVEVIDATFEDARLVDGTFDLIVAAMSFHWVDQTIGLPKLGGLVRPGGWAALWWTVFGDPDRPDPFHQATRHLLDDNTGVVTTHDHRPWELDVAARQADLTDRAHLVDVDAELIRWTIRLDPTQLRALYATMIAIRRRPAAEQEQLLDALSAIAADEFDGIVERPFVTVIYTGRRP